MDRSIRSMSSFVYGVILVATGLAVAVSELTSLGFSQTASVAGLAGGSVVLVAAIMAPRLEPDSIDDEIEPTTTVISTSSTTSTTEMTIAEDEPDDAG